jgi:multidrug resistance efflux pump
MAGRSAAAPHARCRLISSAIMSGFFNRSLRSLEADGSRLSLVGILTVAALLSGWGVWFFGVPVTVVEVSEHARLEAGQTAHPVAAPVGGLVVENRLVLGREVAQGEVLITLDTRALELSLAEKKASIAAIDQRLGPIADEIAAQRKTLRDAEALSRARRAEALAHLREAETGEQFAASEEERQRQLSLKGFISEADLSRSESERNVRGAEADAARSVVARIEAEGQGRESELRGQLARLERDMAGFMGQRTTEEAGVASLAHAIELRRVRAPIAGQLGEIAVLPPGTVLKEGDKIGAVVPAGQFRIIAEFPPAVAFGRIRPGQEARLRLDGFPWVQFGDIKGRVESVASEPRDGSARVEISVLPNAESSIPLQHGLPGVVEIDVEHARPSSLVLRAVGQALGAGRGGGG